MTADPWTDNPRCIYCSQGKTTDVTPPDRMRDYLERWYECVNCFGRFAVRIIPNPQRNA